MAHFILSMGAIASAVLALLVVVVKQKSSTPLLVQNALEKARQLEPPASTLQKKGEYEHGEFWGENDRLLKSAWKEWWQQESSHLPDLMAKAKANDALLINPKLVEAIKEVRQSPTEANERNLQNLFHSIQPGVYEIPWFTPQGVQLLRQHLDAASYYYTARNSTYSTSARTNSTARIPTRRPNGMNRYGIIIDPNIEGSVSYDELNHYIQHMVSDFVRPLARMLFPEVTSRNNPEDDHESYAFTIRYHPDQDMELKEHSDASIYTVNINLNLLADNTEESQYTSTTKEYEGSALYFVQDSGSGKGQRNNVTFTPGMAVLHRGIVRHGSYPITSGERHNLVIWLFGKNDYVRIGEYPKLERLTVKERWSTISSF